MHTDGAYRRSLCNLRQHNRGRGAASVEVPEPADQTGVG